MYDADPMLQGRYRSTGILGQGGMGTVYRVEDVSTGQRFALKRLAEPSTERDRLRFRREFHTLSQLKHPSIVEAHEFGVDEEGLYYTMELLEGAGRWPQRDEGVKEITADYGKELGPDVASYAGPTFHLLKALVDQMPDPVLTEDDKDEKIELGD